MKTVILDFVNVVADLDVKKIFKNLPINYKLSATKLLLTFKEHKDLFDSYQKGELDFKTLQNLSSFLSPTFSKVIPYISSLLSKNIHVNKQVLNLVQEIREKGVQVLCMSNSTPETELVIASHNVDQYFDGIILSTKVKSIKPEPEIYEYAIKKFNISPKDSFMIDDTKKNLITAESFGIEGIHCHNSEDTYETLQAYLEYLDICERTEKLERYY